MIERGALAGALDGVWHDLRGPLGTILGNVEILREGIHGPLPPGVEAHLVAIEAAGRAFLARLDGALA
ncbi:hypothetical protein HS125_14390, partial [bacterium]|nr:hypothetical protein [bacterium]